MYLSSDEACSVTPNSQTPDSPADIAAAEAASTVIDQTFIAANQTWLNLLTRNWQSFADLGPYVAYQARNAAPPLNAASLMTGVVLSDPSGGDGNPVSTPAVSVSSPPPAGVALVSQGNATGTNPAAGGSGRRKMYKHTGKMKPAAQQNDDAAFVAAFGPSPDQISVFSGPLPTQGTVRSLTIGGANRPLAVGPGAYPAPMPDPRFGYSTTCPDPTGVAMLPWGEPLAWGSSGGSGTGGGSAGTSGIGLALAAILGLAAVAYLSEHHETRKRRRAAA